MIRALHHVAVFGFLGAGFIGGCSAEDDPDEPLSGAGGAAAGVGGATNNPVGGAGAGGRGGSPAAGSGGAAVDAGPEFEDPAPEATEPGESRTCDAGGLDSDLSVFVYTDVTETSINLSGTVTGASPTPCPGAST